MDRGPPEGLLRRAILPVVVVVGLVIAGIMVVTAQPTVLFEAEGAFGPVRVLERPDGLRELYIGEGRSRQSAVYPKVPRRLVLEYTRVAMIGPALVAPDARVLFVGLGGGAMPGYLQRVRPELRMEAVEIDPVVVDAARAHFGLSTGSRLQVHIGDGRRFVEAAEPGRWDLIVLDAFSDTDIPPALTTRQFLEAVRRALAPDGFVVGNLPTSADEYAAMVATYRTVFPSVARLEVARRLQHVVLASPLPDALGDERLAAAAAAWPDPERAGFDLSAVVSGARVLDEPPAA
ncbi:MAG: fused MFS/spermidine synthase, partial [Gemmatimonadetes bacterium]|nr:fused MFS/spermidine synthase [Gemmatimonadota bacterium]